MTYLSYLMGAEKIQDKEFENLGVEIVGRMDDGDRMLKIPKNKLSRYVGLIKEKLTSGFWNEIVGEKEIIFIFKLKDGRVEEYKLSPETEGKIDQLCVELNNETPDKTANVYKYITGNSFYRDFMLKHYKDMIER